MSEIDFILTPREEPLYNFFPEVPPYIAICLTPQTEPPRWGMFCRVTGAANLDEALQIFLSSEHRQQFNLSDSDFYAVDPDDLMPHQCAWLERFALNMTLVDGKAVVQ